MHQHEKLNYVEFPCSSMDATKAFFQTVFSWQFEDYGSDYMAFAKQGLDGGFYRSEQRSLSEQGSALVVFYSKDLESTKTKVLNAGGTITKDTFSFPGGRRFQFCEPSGNEFAVWSDL